MTQIYLTNGQEFLRDSELRKGKRPSTCQNYLSSAVALCNWLEKAPDEIGPKDVEEFAIYMLAQNLAPNTRRLKLIGIREYFKWLHDLTGKTNPVEGIKIAREVVTDPLIITPSELVQLVITAAYQQRNNGPFDNVKAARRNAALICLLAETGIRESEAARLCMGSVIKMDNYFQLLVPGGESGLKSLPRSVPFGKLVEGSLVAEYWTRWYLERMGIDSAKREDAIFPVFNHRTGKLLNGKPMGTRLINKTISIIVKRSPVTKNVYPHLLRHYYGTYSVANGLNLTTLSQRMGHARIDTTMRYVHLVDTQVKPDLEHGPNINIQAPPEDSGFVRILKRL